MNELKKFIADMQKLGINIEEVLYFLKQCCKGDIGYYGQIPKKDKPVSPTTATVLLALDTVNSLTEEEKQKQLTELLQFHYPDCSFCKQEGRSSVWATSWTVWCFFAIQKEYEPNPTIEKAVKWLLDTQKDGGWGFDKVSPNRPFYTYYAIRAIKSAYKKLRWKELKRALESALVYINRSQIEGKVGEWAAYPDGTETSLPDTAMALMILLENRREYPHLVSQAVIDTGMTKLVELLKNQETWNVRWEETGTPLFYIRFFTPSLLILLLKYGLPPYDPLCLRFVNWFKESVVKYNKHASGWSGDIERKQNAYCWATALGLITLYHWWRILSTKCDKIEITSFIHKLMSTPLAKEKYERKQLIELSKTLYELRLALKHYKWREKITLLAIVSLISYIVKIPQLLLSLLLILPSTLWIDLLVNIAGSIIFASGMYLLGKLIKLIKHAIKIRRSKEKS